VLEREYRARDNLKSKDSSKKLSKAEKKKALQVIDE
jgi:hypothetical protein